jgi:hypothetical protein
LAAVLDDRSWEKLAFKSGNIPALDGMSFVESSSGKLYLLGGHSISQELGYLMPNTTVYKIDFNSLSVTEIRSPTGAATENFRSLVWSCAAWGPNEEHIYAFGGRTISMIYSNELRRFNIRTGEWERMTPSDFSPSPRASATLTLHPNKKELILFGGRNRFVQKKKTPQNLLNFFLVSLLWSRLLITARIS